MAKIKCMECNKILESKYRWDFVQCGCPNESFLDGGDDYMRLGGKDLSKIRRFNEETKLFIKLPTAEKQEIIEEMKEDELKCTGDCLKHCK